MSYNPYRFYDPIKYEELYHHGILGMKWGIRKERPSSGSNKKRRKKIKLTTSEKVALGLGGAGIATGAVLGALSIRNGIKARKLGNEYLRSTRQKPVMSVSKIPATNKLMESIDTGFRADNLGSASLMATSAGLIPIIAVNNSRNRKRLGLDKKKKKERNE